MPYYKVTTSTLYQSCLSGFWEWSDGDDPMVKARAWVEAENIFEMWKLVQEWFELMHNGEADNRYPDPYWNDEDYPGKVPLNQEVADEFRREERGDIERTLDAVFVLDEGWVINFGDGQGSFKFGESGKSGKPGWIFGESDGVLLDLMTWLSVAMQRESVRRESILLRYTGLTYGA